MSRLDLVNKMIWPLGNTLEILRAQGRIKGLNEKMAASVISPIVMSMIRTANIPDAAKKVIVTTPVGQIYELGALSTALIASEVGWKTLYFGSEIRAEEILSAAESANAGAISLSISNHVVAPVTVRELDLLTNTSDQHIVVFSNLKSLEVLKDIIHANGIIYCQSVDEYRAAMKLLNNTGSHTDKHTHPRMDYKTTKAYK
jgi:hypothetical protein